MKTHWTLSHAAEAADTSTRYIRKLFENGNVHLKGCDKASTGSGHKVGLSPRSIINIALIIELLKVGVRMATASIAALKFSDCGSPGRPLGELFANGSTYLVLKDNASASVVNAAPHTSIFDLVGNSTATVLHVNPIVDRVNKSLGINQSRKSA